MRLPRHRYPAGPADEVTALRARVIELESQARLLEGSEDVVFVIDTQHHRFEFRTNSFLAENDPRDSVATPELRALVHPADRDHFLVDASAWETRADSNVVATEFRLGATPGALRWYRSRYCPLHRDADGRITYVMGVAREVTHQHETRTLVSRLATAIDHAAEPIFVTGPDGVIQYVNPAFERLTGYAASEALGQTPRLLKSGLHDRAFYDRIWEVLGRGEVWTGRITNRKKDGTLYDDETSISPIRGTDGEVVGYVALNRNVTRRMIEERARKMDAIAQLASGIAHDFNNIIQAVRGYSSLALLDLADRPRAKGDIEQVVAVTQSASALVGQLLAFGHGIPTAGTTVRLSDVCREREAGMRRDLGPLYDLALEFSHTGRVRADANVVGELLRRLCENARDAMPDGGTIEVRTWTTALDAAIRERHPEAPDVEYAVLEVTDRGPRLAADALDQLFEPFFTARELGRSAGLGLASVYGITKQQGGLLDCRPGPLGGTTIRVLLPLAEEAESPRSKTPPSENPLPGAATVLVVDDEAQVRSVVRRILERAGHRVIGAADGYDALRQFETYRDEIDVAVLDVVMPGMSGPELLQRLRRTAPGLPALFITGESFGLDAAEGTGPDAEVLKKPFPPHRLLEEVTAALKYRSAANG